MTCRAHGEGPAYGEANVHALEGPFCGFIYHVEHRSQLVSLHPPISGGHDTTRHDTSKSQSTSVDLSRDLRHA